MPKQFSMSQYASKEDMLRDKATHYEQLAKTLAANVDNDALSDAQFRQMVRNCVPEFINANFPESP